MEKDLGLGTSEENSSESSIHSQKKAALDDSALERRYRDAWRRNSDVTLNQFQTSQVLDIFGHDSEAEFYRPRGRIEDNNTRTYNTHRPEVRSRYNEPRRKYSPPEERYYPNPSRAIARSSSYHNIVHPRFLKESRFP
ncbi:hypothetical protein NQ314_003214 [Rhamnusium bicolor]|uniref:Uncharacterized protein n=1 Tax=Rhamnusium bicolor TaxID=1586634 RepID=A0AAV8ZNT8_9CUCU|nr:hypothetical protein NQ314_003214 [Rhamnusium bicolor]